MVSGLIIGVWYNSILPKLAPINFSLTKRQIFKQVAIKVIYDETIMSCFLWTVYLNYCTFLDTFSVKQSIQKWKQDFFTLYISDLCYWPIIVTTVFYYSPLHL
jgi:hypothetical protein